MLIVTGSGVVVLLVAVGVGVMSSGSHPGTPQTGMAPAAFVVSSTHATLAEHTADVSISGAVNLGGALRGSQFSVPGLTTTDLPLTGSGVVDFDTNQLSMTVTSTGSDERILESGGNTYLGVSSDGSNISQMLGGASWIEMPAAQQSSAASGISSLDPMTMMNSLEQKGWTVRPLGTSTIGGTTVTGYAATLSETQAAREIQHELQSGKFSGEIPSKDSQKVKELAGGLGAITLDVYIDGSKLLRQLSVQLGGGGHDGISESFQMTFDNYRTPVNIRTPAPGDVVTHSQLETDFQTQLGSSSL
jgi:hypothetical protein